MVRKGRTPNRSIAVAGLLAALVIPAADAHGECSSLACGHEPLLVVLGVVAVLAPSDVGIAVPMADPSAARLVLGWSWQIPLEHELRHRLVPSFDLLPQGGVSWRGRFGYRYGLPYVFAGAGASFGDGDPVVSLSPEVGVKFAHLDTRADGRDHASLHLLARAEIEPESGHVRAGTILLGWNLF